MSWLYNSLWKTQFIIYTSQSWHIFWIKLLGHVYCTKKSPVLEGLGIHPTTWPDSKKGGFSWQCKDTLVCMHDWWVFCCLLQRCQLVHCFGRRYRIPLFLSIHEKVSLASSFLHWMTPHCTYSPSHFCLLPNFHVLCLQPLPDDLGGWNGDWALEVSIAELASGCWTFIMLAQIVTQRRTRKMSAMSMNHAFEGGCSWTFRRIWTTTWCHC